MPRSSNPQAWQGWIWLDGRWQLTCTAETQELCMALLLDRDEALAKERPGSERRLRVQRPRTALVLEALEQAVPADVRLRRALKALLRSYGMRNLSCRELTPEE